MAACGEVLVVIMNSREDWAIAWEQHWYRIHVDQVEKLKQRQHWLPPTWIAFYQTKVFGADAYAVRYYARIKDIRAVSRCELFPEEAFNTKSQNCYYQVKFEPVQALAQPIRSDRLRRLTFIATTWEQLMTAQELGDL